jgi:hypothetical protein
MLAAVVVVVKVLQCSIFIKKYSTYKKAPIKFIGAFLFFQRKNYFFSFDGAGAAGLVSVEPPFLQQDFPSEAPFLQQAPPFVHSCFAPFASLSQALATNDDEAKNNAKADNNNVFFMINIKF